MPFRFIFVALTVITLYFSVLDPDPEPEPNPDPEPNPKPDLDPHRSALRWPPWIRIRIRIRDADSRSGSRSFKITEN